MLTGRRAAPSVVRRHMRAAGDPLGLLTNRSHTHTHTRRRLEVPAERFFFLRNTQAKDPAKQIGGLDLDGPKIVVGLKTGPAAKQGRQAVIWCQKEDGPYVRKMAPHRAGCHILIL